MQLALLTNHCNFSSNVTSHRCFPPNVVTQEQTHFLVEKTQETCATPTSRIDQQQQKQQRGPWRPGPRSSSGGKLFCRACSIVVEHKRNRLLTLCRHKTYGENVRNTRRTSDETPRHWGCCVPLSCRTESRSAGLNMQGQGQGQACRVLEGLFND